MLLIRTWFCVLLHFARVGYKQWIATTNTCHSKPNASEVIPTKASCLPSSNALEKCQVTADGIDSAKRWLSSLASNLVRPMNFQAWNRNGWNLRRNDGSKERSLPAKVFYKFNRFYGSMGWFRDDAMFGWAEFQSWLKSAETLSLPNKGKKWEKQRGSRIALPLETILSESMWFKISWTWRGWKKPFPKRKHTCHKTKNTRPLGGNTLLHEATTKPSPTSHVCKGVSST